MAQIKPIIAPPKPRPRLRNQNAAKAPEERTTTRTFRLPPDVVAWLAAQPPGRATAALVELVRAHRAS